MVHDILHLIWHVSGVGVRKVIEVFNVWWNGNTSGKAFSFRELACVNDV